MLGHGELAVVEEVRKLLRNQDQHFKTALEAIQKHEDSALKGQMVQLEERVKKMESNLLRALHHHSGGAAAPAAATRHSVRSEGMDWHERAEHGRRMSLEIPDTAARQKGWKQISAAMRMKQALGQVRAPRAWRPHAYVQRSRLAARVRILSVGRSRG